MTRRTVTTPVYEVMTREPITVTPATPIGDLLSLFAQHDFNAFPVLDPGGALRGIVTKLDVLRLFRPDPALRIADYPTLSAAHVADIMRRGIVSVEPDDPLIVAADLMVETRLHSLPVVHRSGTVRNLVGIVSQGDLLRGVQAALVEPMYAEERDAAPVR